MLSCARVAAAFLGCVLGAPAQAQFTALLKPATERAFDEYRQSAEARLTWTPRFADPAPGAVAIAPVEKKGALEVPDGMLHDWAAATLVPGAKVEEVLAVLQNYAEYKSIYAPEVAESRLLARDGNRFRAFLHLVKKKGITAHLNSEYEIEYRPLASGAWSLVSRSTKMAELADGQEVPPNRGHGYLWRLNAYWLLAPRPGGVYLECRTISLTRDIPTGLGWAVRPFVSSLPRESLESTLLATARAAQR